MTPEEVKKVSATARCLYTEIEVEAALDRMAAAISGVLEQSSPILLCVMNGGLIVSGKLATRLRFPLQMDYLHATRYQDKTVGAELQWKVYPSLSLKQRTVLIVDDILDEGVTLGKIITYCQEQGARKIYTAVLVDKQHARKEAGISADFVGVEAEDYYLFGYGMDYQGYLRNAAGIYAIDDTDT
ncbi:MAG: hypoxanthine-guanine phosphoribosyltransferase [Gammaproteobacteria bacterium]|nr:hypoxanthine-guanine phosphoribosyltransferase [Gammaproteobacteria bacterium]